MIKLGIKIVYRGDTVPKLPKWWTVKYPQVKNCPTLFLAVAVSPAGEEYLMDDRGILYPCNVGDDGERYIGHRPAVAR